MIGDELRKNIFLFANAETNKNGKNAFWKILKDIAIKEIINYQRKIDSDTIIPIYYKIMRENLKSIPEYFRQIIPSNKQERFRVIIRNVFSSNAFNSDGLANCKNIIAFREVNESKKGNRIIYMKAEEDNVNKE